MISRATLQAKSATSVGNNDNVFAGDILLRFKHKPQPESGRLLLSTVHVLITLTWTASGSYCLGIRINVHLFLCCCFLNVLC